MWTIRPWKAAKKGWWTRWQRLVWINDKGEILRRKEVDLGSRLSLGSPRNMMRIMTAWVPAPLFVIPVAVFRLPQDFFLDDDAEADQGRPLGQALSESWPTLLVVLLLAAGLAWLCYRRQRRYGLGWTGAWVVFVFLLGVPGMIGYLFHRRWPVLESCPACGRRVPRDREACCWCGAEFPLPEQLGTEVFV